jgi:GTP-binding protein Era
MPLKAGFVSLIGQPNVGKSTLLNALVGQKVSIVSSKPQTTRKRVLGIAQTDRYQIAFVDTPGIHEPHNRLGRAMVEQARTALADIDAILIVADVSRRPDDMEKHIAELVRPVGESGIPLVLCLNKMDLLKPEFVVDNVEAFCSLYGTERYMLTTADKGQNLEQLIELLLSVLPEGDEIFPDDEFTDQSTRFMVSELIREKVLLKTRQEVPHATAVSIDSWEEQEDGPLEIGATIYVEKASQRAIVIGKGGQFIKQIGTEARAEIEALLNAHVFLELHVKVSENWRQSPRALRELEYTE